MLVFFSFFFLNRRFIKDFSKIAQPLCNLLQKDVSFYFDKSCQLAFDTLKTKLTSTLIIQPHNWDYHCVMLVIG